jgi:hypothetical protein
MISALHYNDQSTASRMLDLVARHCPRLMRCCGGSLSGEEIRGKDSNKGGPRISAETRAKILAVAREGKLSATAIARQCGTTQSTVRSLLIREDVPIVVDGRGARDGNK